MHTAGTGMGNGCSGAVVLRSPLCIVGASSVVGSQECCSRVSMYLAAGQGGFGMVCFFAFWCWLVRRLCGLWLWAVVIVHSRRAGLGVKN